MRVPYAVGRWVRGRAHYDRDQLVETLLAGPSQAYWLIGTRRMGKTSLLRHLELIAEHGSEELVPLFWDLQGSESPADLARELADSLALARDRFDRGGAPLITPEEADARSILRGVVDGLTACGCRLLLLVDEAEVLAQIAQRHPAWVADLVELLTQREMRTVLASTKWLAKLDDSAGDGAGQGLWHAFHALFLNRLDEVAARALVRQEQGEQPVAADDGTVDDIIVHTNGHPYLTQFLCQRLFVVDQTGQCRLRPVRDEDLEPDQLLAAFFANDFRSLTSTEQQLVLSVAKHRAAKLRNLMDDLPDVPPGLILLYLYGLDRLGYLRRVFGQWAIGNEFLRRWLRAEAPLPAGGASAADDHLYSRLIESARQNEMVAYQTQLAEAEAELRKLEIGGLPLIGEETRLVLERGAQLHRRIAKLKRDLGEIAYTPVT
jgi:hypothetical protein